MHLREREKGKKIKWISHGLARAILGREAARTILARIYNVHMYYVIRCEKCARQNEGEKKGVKSGMKKNLGDKRTTRGF